jgi:hypothetical protein
VVRVIPVDAGIAEKHPVFERRSRVHRILRQMQASATWISGPGY